MGDSPCWLLATGPQAAAAAAPPPPARTPLLTLQSSQARPPPALPCSGPARRAVDHVSAPPCLRASAACLRRLPVLLPRLPLCRCTNSCGCPAQPRRPTRLLVCRCQVFHRPFRCARVCAHVRACAHARLRLCAGVLRRKRQRWRLACPGLTPRNARVPAHAHTYSRTRARTHARRMRPGNALEFKAMAHPDNLFAKYVVSE